MIKLFDFTEGDDVNGRLTNLGLPEHQEKQVNKSSTNKNGFRTDWESNLLSYKIRRMLKAPNFLGSSYLGPIV